jgi:hypothetical protein
MTKQIAPETGPDFAKKRIFERPDGFYWEDIESGETYGPFPTLLDAENDRRYTPDGPVEPGESVQEAESEIGIAEWIDPETGEPAEENVPRIEQH